MKFSIVAAATIFVLSGPALAQSSSSGGVSSTNGLDLGHSMPGTNAGVPYPNPATTERAAPVATGGTKEQSAAPPKHPKKSGT